MNHYVITAGMQDMHPDLEEAYPAKSGAIEAAEELYELTEYQTKRLSRSKVLYLDNNHHGVDYVRIQVCDCDTPWDHSDVGVPADWSEYV